MVDYITGINGAGKSRVLFEAAVSTAEISDGNVVFIDCGDRLNNILPSNIRLINMLDYELGSATAFFGFLIGLCASDYDLTDVFVDSAVDVIASSHTNPDDFFEILAKVSEKTGVNFHFAVCDKYTKELAYSSN